MNEDQHAEYERLKDKLEDLTDRIRELEITLHGKRAKTGLLAEYERHDQLLARMYAVIWQDPTGQKGILRDLDILMGRKESKEKGGPVKWQVMGMIVTALLASATSIFLQWDRVKTFLPKHKPTQYEKAIQKARHPKSPKKIYQYRVVKPPLAPGNTTEQNRISPPPE